MNTNKQVKIGILVCGHKEYWPQFPGVKERIMTGAEAFRNIVSASGAQIFMSEMVDCVELSFAAGEMFRQNDIDLLFVYLHTYVASGRWIPGITGIKAPVVVVTLTENIDFDDPEIQIIDVLKKGSPCQLPETVNALRRTDINVSDVIFGCIDDDDRAHARINEWCDAAKALREYKGAVIGYLGHVYDGMMDMNSDPTSFTRQFGIYIKMLEMCELADFVENASEKEIKEKLDDIKNVFDITGASYDPTTKDVIDSDIEWAARCAAGLDRLVETNSLSGLAYYYAGLNNLYERIASNLIIGNTLLTKRGINLAGEADLQTCIAMKTTCALGAGGSFAELTIADFNKDLVFIGHDGPHDLRIGNARPQIRGLGVYHGKRGQGISVEYSIRNGDISMVSLTTDKQGAFRFVVAEGSSVPGNVPKIGNTMTRGYFGKDVRKFIEDWSMEGPPHHMSLCVGHVGSRIQKIGKALGIDVKIVRSGNEL